MITTLLVGAALAGTPAESVWGVDDGTGADAGVAPDVAPTVPAGKELSALGLLQARVTRSSVVTTNPFLDGQVIGSLGGINGTTTSLDERSFMSEQRAVGFLTWAPGLLDGQAALTAAFEVDFVWGDQAYQTGGNKGGGFGADQVNLQTRRLYGSFEPHLGGGHDLTLIAGLQFLADGAFDPHSATPDRLFRHGGGLKIWGSEAAGVAAYGRYRTDWGTRLHYRIGGFALVENGVGLADDVTMWVADAELHPAYAVDVGLHTWWLKDNSGGSGGSLGIGPTSQLSQLQGGPRLIFQDAAGDAAEVDADLLWLAADAGWNRDLSCGPIGLKAGGLLNLGRLYVTDQEDVDVRGWLVDGEARYRWTRGQGSVISLQGLASSRDDGGVGGQSPDTYTGIVTGNSYGVVGAVWATHGTLLLFPDPGAINRQVAVVSDVSGAGQGLVAAALSVGFDPLPNQLTLRGTSAHATSAAGDPLGTETGGAVVWHPLPLMDLGLHGAFVTGAEVIDPTTSQLTELPAVPWTVLAHLQWVLF